MKEVFIIHFNKLEKPLISEGFKVMQFLNENDALAEIDQRKYKQQPLPDVILYHPVLEFIGIKNTVINCEIPVIIVADQYDETLKSSIKESGAIDYYAGEIDTKIIASRINSLDHWLKKSKHRIINVRYNLPVWKRLFDIAVSLTLLILLLPLFLIISLLIRLESKGSVFYSSPRVGTGYKIFPFYKFRSMRMDADQMLKKMKHLNHYKTSETIKETFDFDDAGPMLVGDDELIPEQEYHQKVKIEEKQAFMKIQNDPRITRVGHFIRKTSIDELPQLFNVFLGHMSIVGNRPLPLYEAEKLTSDEWALRFMAPAGITGLWQVTERGKKTTSEDSRKKLDLVYAKKYSIWMDLKILIKTPLALFQHEDV